MYKAKSNAIGSDDLPLKFMKSIYQVIEHYILHIFNTIILTSCYPSSWKTSRIFPIKKKDRNFGLENYRPISILCSLSKIFETILKDQMLFYINSKKLLSKSHLGFVVY